jgi:3,4-dihydroxy 2-butanone 4-phosphate synthase / GTP cyclohydrolase II
MMMNEQQFEQTETTPLATIDEAIRDMREGKMVILVDDEDRENEGDLTMAAEKVTPDAINFMTKHGRGLICLSLAPELTNKLGLPMMVQDNTSPFNTAFTISINARLGISTGLSARDRATTILTAVADQCRPEDLVQPGHVFPLRAREGGVLVRTGQTEGSVDLSRLAGLKAAGVICEILKTDGTMARMPDLKVFAAEHDLKIVTVADLIKYRVQKETLVHRAGSARLPTPYGVFAAIAYTNDVDEHQHLALVKGEISPNDEVLVRVHSECLTGDVFGSLRCDCGDQLAAAMSKVEAEGKGVILYMHQEGRGIGLMNKLRAYQLQDQGVDTVEANKLLGFAPDLRDYGIGAQILADLGIKRMRLLTNNPGKIIGLQGYGLEVIERVPIEAPPNPKNVYYLKTKCIKLGHLMGLARH